MTKTKTGIARSYMSKMSYMELEDQQDDHLVYTTRRYGDILHEEPSEEDIAHANKMRDVLSKSNIDSDIETVDEWVYLTIKID